MPKMLFGLIGLMLSVALALPMSLSDRLARLEQQVNVHELEQRVAEQDVVPAKYMHRMQGRQYYLNMLEKFCHIKYWGFVRNMWINRMSENMAMSENDMNSREFREKDVEIKKDIVKHSILIFQNCYKEPIYQEKKDQPCEDDYSGGSKGCKMINHTKKFMDPRYMRG